MKSYMYPFTRDIQKGQAYGANPNNGINPRKGHTGDDWRTPVGTPIHAAGDGVIEVSSWPTANYLDSAYWLTSAAGDALVLNCGDNEPTFIYGHNSVTSAEPGTWVKKGDVIGYTGNTGLSTGPHCHVEVMPPGFDLNDGAYGRVNPELYFSEHIEDYTAPVSVVVPEPKKVDKMLFIASDPNDGTGMVWIGDGVTRRHIPDPSVLQHYRNVSSVMPIYKDGEIQQWPPSVLGVDIQNTIVQNRTAIALSSGDIAELAKTLKETLAPDVATELARRLTN